MYLELEDEKYFGKKIISQKAASFVIPRLILRTIHIKEKVPIGSRKPGPRAYRSFERQQEHPQKWHAME